MYNIFTCYKQMHNVNLLLACIIGSSQCVLPVCCLPNEDQLLPQVISSVLLFHRNLIVSLVFSHLGFWSGNLFLIAPFPDLCLLVPVNIRQDYSGFCHIILFDPDELTG